MSELVVHCPRCGAELQDGSTAEGLCPGCLLTAALSDPALPTSVPAELPAPGEPFSGFRILRVLGEGGMGIVYLAEQEQPLRRQVALKVIKLGMDTRAVVARFQSERQALALMDHPNIAQVYEAGSSGHGRPYFAMEYVPGLPITQYSDEHRLNTNQRLDLFLQICDAVQHAHQKGVIHRDLKPSNVLVTERDGHAVPKIIDFGLAKATGQRLTEETMFTRAGVVIGTPEYMSPEQAVAGSLDIDTRTDIYSLGVLLYELLVGAAPFDHKELRQAGWDEIRRVIRDEDPPRPTTRLQSLGAAASGVAQRRNTDAGSLANQLRGDLDWIIMKALEKDRARRYASASELAADLERHLRDELVMASPASAAYRVRKYVRKNRVKVVGAATALLCLVAGMGVSTVMYFRSERLRALAERQSYAANVNVAETHIQSGDSASAKRFLLLCPPSLRGWEWRYLWHEADASVTTLYAQQVPLGSPVELHRTLAFRPDRSRLYLNTDAIVQAWDDRTFRPAGIFGGFGRILTMDRNASRILVGAAVSRPAEPVSPPMPAGVAGNTLRVVDPVTGASIANLRGLDGQVLAAAFSDDGANVATGASDGTLRIWDAKSGQAIIDLPPYASPVSCLAFSPDGTRAAAGYGDGTLRMFDLASKRVRFTEQGMRFAERGNGFPVASLVFSPDGSQIAAAWRFGSIRVQNAASGAEISIVTIDSSNVALALAFDPEGKRLISGVRTDVKIWEAATGRALTTLIGFGNARYPVVSVAFSPDGKRALAASLRGEVKIWEALPDDAPQVTGERAVLGPPFPAVSADGSVSVLRGSDNTVEVRRLDSGKVVSTLAGPLAGISRLSVSPDGKLVAGASSDKSLRVWNAGTGTPLWELRDHNGAVGSMAWSPDGTRLASAGVRGKTVCIWKARSGQTVATVAVPADPRMPIRLAFSPDGSRIVAGFALVIGGRQAGTIAVWDGRTGEAILEPGRGERLRSTPMSVACSPDGKRIAAGLADGEIHVFDGVNGKSLAHWQAQDAIGQTVAWSPDGARIVSGLGKSIRIWDAVTFEPLVTLRERRVNMVMFTTDGTRLISGSPLHVWDTRSAYHPDAEALVDSLYQKFGFARDVLAQLETDRKLDDSLRPAAIRLAQARGEQPGLLNELSWKVVKSAGASAEAYHLAQRQAEEAVRLAPWYPNAVGTLGFAHYRLGEYLRAIDALARAGALFGIAQPADVACQAMARYRLGQVAQARAGLEQARMLMRGSRFTGDPDTESVLAEAETILGGQWVPTPRKK